MSHVWTGGMQEWWNIGMMEWTAASERTLNLIASGFSAAFAVLFPLQVSRVEFPVSNFQSSINPTFHHSISPVFPFSQRDPTVFSIFGLCSDG
jgi:hypothetical protein